MLILSCCDERENMVIINVKKKVLDTDPTFLCCCVFVFFVFLLLGWLGFGGFLIIMQNLFFFFFLQPALNAQLIYHVLQICSPTEILRHTGWVLGLAIRAPDYYCQCFRRCNQFRLWFTVGDWSALNATVFV